MEMERLTQDEFNEALHKYNAGLVNELEIVELIELEQYFEDKEMNKDACFLCESIIEHQGNALKDLYNEIDIDLFDDKIEDNKESTTEEIADGLKFVINIYFEKLLLFYTLKDDFQKIDILIKVHSNIMGHRINDSILIGANVYDKFGLYNFELYLLEQAKNDPLISSLVTIQIAITTAKAGNIDEGISILQKQLDQNPYDVQTWIKLSQFFIYKKDYEEALECLKNAYSIEDTNMLCLRLLVDYYCIFPNYDKAEELILNAHPSLKEDIYYSFLVAHIIHYKKNKNTKKAIDILDKLIKKSPTFVDAYNLLANIYFNENDPQKAYFYVAKAAELEPEDPILKGFLGLVLYSLGNISSADQIFNELIETSTDLNIIENIACVYIDGNEISKAKKVVEHILNLNPQNEFAISLMSICNKFSENKEEARAQYVKLINTKKNEPYS